MKAFLLFLLKLALYARRTRTPTLCLRRPTLSSLRVIVFIILKAVFIFPECDLGAKVSTKLALKNLYPRLIWHPRGKARWHAPTRACRKRRGSGGRRFGLKPEWRLVLQLLHSQAGQEGHRFEPYRLFLQPPLR